MEIYFICAQILNNLTTHYSLLTTHYSRLITHGSPLIAHRLQLPLSAIERISPRTIVVEKAVWAVGPECIAFVDVHYS